MKGKWKGKDWEVGKIGREKGGKWIGRAGDK